MRMIIYDIQVHAHSFKRPRLDYAKFSSFLISIQERACLTLH